MPQLPENTVTQQDMEQWYEVQEKLAKLKTIEVLLRQKIFKGKFPAPKEGVNTIELGDGYVLKGGHVINRNIDPAALNALKDEFVKAGIHTDELVRYKPELKVGDYRKLTEEQRQLFDQALIVKEGMPSLEIVLPKRASKG